MSWKLGTVLKKQGEKMLSASSAMPAKGNFFVLLSTLIERIGLFCRRDFYSVLCLIIHLKQFP